MELSGSFPVRPKHPKAPTLSPLPTWQPPLTLTEKGVPDTQHCGEGQGAGEEAQEPLGQVEQGPDAHLLQVLVHTREQPPQQGHEHLGVQLHSFLRPWPSAPPLPNPGSTPSVPSPSPMPSDPIPASHHVGPVVAWQVKLADLHQAPEGFLGTGHKP